MITITITSMGFQRRSVFSPLWGPEDPSGVQSSLCVFLSVFTSVYLSVYLYISLSSRPGPFLEIKVCGP